MSDFDFPSDALERLSITEERIQSILDAHPTLNDNGFSSARKDVSNAGKLNAAHLAKKLPLTVAILLTVPRTKTPRVSSYGVKHDLEDIVGYLTNGELIVAAALAGFRIDADIEGLNTYLPIHRAWRTWQLARVNGELGKKGKPTPADRKRARDEHKAWLKQLREERKTKPV
jgi:hypothetical protein